MSLQEQKDAAALARGARAAARERAKEQQLGAVSEAASEIAKQQSQDAETFAKDGKPKAAAAALRKAQNAVDIADAAAAVAEDPSAQQNAAAAKKRVRQAQKNIVMTEEQIAEESKQDKENAKRSKKDAVKYLLKQLKAEKKRRNLFVPVGAKLMKQLGLADTGGTLGTPDLVTLKAKLRELDEAGLANRVEKNRTPPTPRRKLAYALANVKEASGADLPDVDELERTLKRMVGTKRYAELIASNAEQYDDEWSRRHYKDLEAEISSHKNYFKKRQDIAAALMLIAVSVGEEGDWNLYHGMLHTLIDELSRSFGIHGDLGNIRKYTNPKNMKDLASKVKAAKMNGAYFMTTFNEYMSLRAFEDVNFKGMSRDEVNAKDTTYADRIGMEWYDLETDAKRLAKIKELRKMKARFLAIPSGERASYMGPDKVIARDAAIAAALVARKDKQLASRKKQQPQQTSSSFGRHVRRRSRSSSRRRRR